MGPRITPLLPPDGSTWGGGPVGTSPGLFALVRRSAGQDHGEKTARNPAPLRYVGVRPIDSAPVDGPPSLAHSGRNRGGRTIQPDLRAGCAIARNLRNPRPAAITRCAFSLHRHFDEALYLTLIPPLAITSLEGAEMDQSQYVAEKHEVRKGQLRRDRIRRRINQGARQVRSTSSGAAVRTSRMGRIPDRCQRWTIRFPSPIEWTAFLCALHQVLVDVRELLVLLT
jgi:hypothetical protein